MKFLGSPKLIEAELKRLIRTSTRFRWAVAWASQKSPLFDLLKKGAHKIDQLTVGIHFYQTDPEFIAAFMKHGRARFVMNPAGVFHPKLYFFELDGGRWECVVGSPNFTQSGLQSNNEVAVHFTQSDLNAGNARSEIEAALNSFWSLGRKLSQSDLDAYRSIWQRQQKRLNPLSGNYRPDANGGRAGKSPLEVPLFVEDWPAYFNSVKDDKTHTAEGRLAVLEEASRLFSEYGHFEDMEEADRKGIAGIVRTETFDWLWFGSMKGAGYFKQAVGQNNKRLSEALDAIPLAGTVTRADFERFVKSFQGAFKNAGVATGTRLLTFKRPDYFVCFDSKNKRRLCESFEISQNVTLDDYWERVVERITDSNWWNSPEPSGKLERRIWRCRAAFLDVLFYEA